MRIVKSLLPIAALCAAWPASTQQAAPPATPLFATNDLLRLTLKGDYSTLTRADSDERPTVQGSLEIGGEVLQVQLQPRGITRRKKDVCQFPPLRVRFNGAPPANSVFEGQRQLKLVTHCRGAESFNQYTLMEYAAYRLFNELTPLSFRARLAQVDYIDNGGKLVARRFAFFIEDIDDVAKRNGMREAKMGTRFPVTKLTAKDSARFALFEYMIGNLDWAMQAGPGGDDCCHNSKPIGVGGTSAAQLVPVPYDFDFSGLVNAPYAEPPFGVPVSSVRQRRYRGLCRHNIDAQSLYPDFRAMQGKVATVFASIPGLDGSSQGRAINYLNGFFDDIATDQQAATKILKTCLG